MLNVVCLVSMYVREVGLDGEGAVSGCREGAGVDVTDTLYQVFHLRAVTTIDGDLCHLTVEGNGLQHNNILPLHLV